MKSIGATRVGQKLATLRKAVGLTQAQLAEKVATQSETISRIETGHMDASLKLLTRISEALEIELHELFRPYDVDNPKDGALARLVWWASRLSPAEIELVMNVGAAALGHAPRTLHGQPTRKISNT